MIFKKFNYDFVQHSIYKEIWVFMCRKCAQIEGFWNKGDFEDQL